MYKNEITQNFNPANMSAHIFYCMDRKIPRNNQFKGLPLMSKLSLEDSWLVLYQHPCLFWTSCQINTPTIRIYIFYTDLKVGPKNKKWINCPYSRSSFHLSDSLKGVPNTCSCIELENVIEMYCLSWHLVSFAGWIHHLHFCMILYSDCSRILST